MNWLIQLLSPRQASAWATAILQAVAWPAAMVAVAAMFRTEVRNVLERLVRLKYQNFEAQFQAELRRSEEIAAKAAPRRLIDLPVESRRLVHEVDAPAAGAAPAPDPASRRDPRGAIEEAWSQLAAAADRAAGTAGIDPVPALAERGHLAGPSLLLFDQLRQLRGQAALRPEWVPSPADAARFVALARPLTGRLANITPEAGVVRPDRGGERAA